MRLLDRYTVLDRIGSGGMATIYRATDDRLDRVVCIKLLRTTLIEGSGSNNTSASPVSVVINVAGDATDTTIVKMQGVARQIAEQQVAAQSKGLVGSAVQAVRNEIVRDPAFMRR